MPDYAIQPLSRWKPRETMTMAPAKIDDLDLQAFVDNQASLNTDQRARIWQAISDDPDVRRRYEDLQLQKQMLQLWWEENKRETLQ